MLSKIGTKTTKGVFFCKKVKNKISESLIVLNCNCWEF